MPSLLTRTCRESGEGEAGQPGKLLLLGGPPPARAQPTLGLSSAPTSAHQPRKAGRASGARGGAPSRLGLLPAAIFARLATLAMLHAQPAHARAFGGGPSHVAGSSAGAAPAAASSVAERKCFGFDRALLRGGGAGFVCLFKPDGRVRFSSDTRRLSSRRHEWRPSSLSIPCVRLPTSATAAPGALHRPHVQSAPLLLPWWGSPKAGMTRC